MITAVFLSFEQPGQNVRLSESRSYRGFVCPFAGFFTKVHAADNCSNADLSGCNFVDCEFWTQHVINDVKKPAYGHQKVLCKLLFDRRTFHQGCRKPKNTPDRSAGAVFEILAPAQISSRSLPEHPWLHGKYSCENNYEKNRTI